MKCQVCGIDFEGRADAKCCSSGCRSRLSRGLSVAPGDLSVATDGLKLCVATDPKLVEQGDKVALKKKVDMAATKLDPVSGDEPCNVFSGEKEGYLDLEKDLHLDLKKDLGVFAWSSDGIFIRPDITIDQVQNIARLIHAKHSRPCPIFLECR